MTILLKQSLSYFTLFIERYSSIVEWFIIKEEEADTVDFILKSFYIETLAENLTL